MDGHCGKRGSSAPAITDSAVYVSYVCPQTYRFDPKTGAQIWHYSGDCEGGGGESAAVYHGLVFARDLYNYSTDGIALFASNGTLAGGFNSQYSPVFASNYAFLTESITLTAVKINDGSTLWTAVASAGENYFCAPIVVTDVVYMGTSAGNIEAYSARTGKKVDSVSLGQPVSCGEYFAVPLAGMSAGGGLLVVPAGNSLVALK